MNMTHRVVQRYLKASGEPSRLALTILNKLAKGIKGTVSIDALKEALAFLPGWSVEDTVTAVPLGYPQDLMRGQGFVPKNGYVGGVSVHDTHFMFVHRHNYTEGPVTEEVEQTAQRDASVQLAHLKSKVELVSTSKGPSNPVPGKLYLYQLRIEKEDSPPYEFTWKAAWNEY